MRNSVVVDNPFARPDMPADIGVGQQPFPPRRASAHANPHENGDKEKVGKRGNRQPSPRIQEQFLNPDAAFMRTGRSNSLGRSHLSSYSPDPPWYFSPMRQRGAVTGIENTHKLAIVCEIPRLIAPCGRGSVFLDES